MSDRSFAHEPVLVDALLRYQQPQPGHVYLDGTVGLGGHAWAILPRILPGGTYLGIDVDSAILASAAERLGGFGAAVRLEHGNYAEAPEILSRLGIDQVDHMLLDLGINSAQLDNGARGFSFDTEGPLDMRFDTRRKTTATDLVNSLSERELSDMFYEFGQESQSRKIAKRICQVRHSGRITTTRALARAVEAAVGAEGGKVHPATRVFQALRVAVNRELDHLQGFLTGMPGRLRVGGTLAVISFHSLEDALVKRALRSECGVEFEELTKRPELPDAQERGRNPRSRSAKLRVARRVK